MGRGGSTGITRKHGIRDQETQAVHSTGIEVPCFIDGDVGAPPLLLLHASGESFENFDRRDPLLAGFRVYAPDLRGQGDADKPQGGYSLAEQATDTAAILDALEVPRAFVLGSSSGRGGPPSPSRPRP